MVSADNYTKMDRQVHIPPYRNRRKVVLCLGDDSPTRLPGLIVNVGDRSISSINDRPVQLRINDIEVTIDEITALDPQKIKKVEYIDLPGMRLWQCRHRDKFRSETNRVWIIPWRKCSDSSYFTLYRTTKFF